MQITYTRDQLRRMRLHHQRLNDASKSSSPADTVSALCALQSQEWSSAQLAIHARTSGITQADVKRAREVDRAFVLTWTLRGTLHLVAAADLRWQSALCGPGAIRATRRRYQELGLAERFREKALEAINEILSRKGALIRSELAKALAARGIPVEGQAIHHLVRFAALRGLICLGPEHDGDLAYVLLEDWLPGCTTDLAPEDPLGEFARRYLAAFAPVTGADFAKWSGLGAAAVRQAWQAVAAESVTVAIPGGEALMLKEQLEQIDNVPTEPRVRFLPRYDNYLLGYESRAFMVEDAYAKQVHPGGGLIRSCVTIDGEARASWKLEKRRKGARITVSPYEGLNANEVSHLEVEAESLGKFLNTTVELRVDCE